MKEEAEEVTEIFTANIEVPQEELDKATKDQNYIMKLSKSDLPKVKIRAKGPKYTPVSKRGDKPDAIAFLLKQNPELTDAQIARLIGTTKPTINSVRDRTHPNSPNLRPRNPVDLGLCSYTELDTAVNKALKAQGKDPEEIKKQKEMMYQEQKTTDTKEDPMAGFDFTNFLKSDSSSSEEEST